MPEAEPKSYYLVTPLAGGGQAGAFTYSGPTGLEPGQLVTVPLGRRTSVGVVEAVEGRPEFATRDIIRVLDLPAVPRPLRELAGWLAAYYACAPADAWTAILPAGIQQKPRAAAGTAKPAPPRTALPPLTPAQQAAFTAISADGRTTQLLEGVTGSGKTRIYLELAEQTLAAGRSVIVLVPEIMLTPQLVSSFEAQFGAKVIATHSQMTPARRRNAWTAALTSPEPVIAMGPRSSLFLPVPRPGLIIIDECHETSYKQEQAPRYHAVPTAARLASLCGAKLVLGSATPGLTELMLAAEGRIGLQRLPDRAGGQPLPEVSLVDLRDKSAFGRNRLFSQPLLEALTDTLAAGRQSLLFINRRGSASSQICAACGQATLCPRCQLPLTFHADLMKLVCHHCNYRAVPPAICPECGAGELRYLGGGTKRVEEELSRLFPQARIARIDRDSATPQHMAATYAGLKDGGLDLLVGTQMIAKGLDLPMIDTVGVVSADTMLHLPDFNAAERTAALLVQVAGRAGRGAEPGRVIIQSYTPDHPALQAVRSHDYAAFAAAELAERQKLGYPPYRYLLKLTVSSASRETSQLKAAELAAALRGRPGVHLMGPAPALLETAGGRYHWVLVAKSASRPPLVQIAREAPRGWTADLDPLSLL